ncbi:MAG TPA: histidine phosphatase family protein [Candidatus Limnocylindrales bacterium]|nr:histidine phosphatase family protein [Candidatus Limnocylindrales bacterium]
MRGRILLWRHGNTDWNNAGRIQGQTDSLLNEHGRAQAAAAAERLAMLKPSLIISSDLSRCWDTVVPLAKLTGLTAEREPRLRERSFGSWEKLTITEVKQRFPESHARWAEGGPDPGDGLEPLADLGKRVAEVIRQAHDRNPDGMSILVTHGGSVRWGVATLLGWPGELGLTLGGLRNCHWSELGIHPEYSSGWQLLTHNVGV